MANQTRCSWRSVAFVGLVGLSAAPAGTIAQTSSTPAFSGQAYVVQATVPPLAPITVADTGPLPSTGGAEQAALLDVPAIPLGNVGAVNGADVAHASTVGQGNASRSEASVADLSLTVAGNTVAADFLMARSLATCKGSQAAVSGSSELAALTINGQTVTVSGATNQTIDLPLGAGFVVINEQSGSASGQSGQLDVNALHVVVNGTAPGAAPLADVVVAHAHADITCPASQAKLPPCGSAPTDFVTGGGWIVSPSNPNAKANFAVAGGIKNGAFWGHLLYLDHGNGPRVKGTSVTGYGFGPFGPNSRQTSGLADVNGATQSYEADVSDDGEPGAGLDRFQLKLDGVPVNAQTLLAGGNIQLHKNCQ